MAQVQTESTKKSIDFKALIIIVLTLLILMLISMGVIYYVLTIAAPGKADAKTQSTNLITYEAGEILTNLKDKGYIKMSMVYLMDDKNVEKELKQKEYEIKDNIFSILRSKAIAQVKDSTGMEQLRIQIRESINDILTQGEIIDVYFTSIIVN